MRRLLLATAACAALLVACDPSDPAVPGPDPDPDQLPVAGACQPGSAPSDPYVDCIESFTPVDATYGQDRMPQVVLGPPVPGKPGVGSLDVLSLGCGGEVTLFFDDPAIVDGPGPDFIVYENPLAVGDGAFIEPARVYASPDGEAWYGFPCDPAGDAPGCAGVTPAVADAEPTNLDAGGDAFDLADLGLTSARYLRLVDVGVEHYGHTNWCAGASGGFDLDAVAVVRARE